eukprot:5426093-Amphidinium_carterae.1
MVHAVGGKPRWACFNPVKDALKSELVNKVSLVWLLPVIRPPTWSKEPRRLADCGWLASKYKKSKNR